MSKFGGSPICNGGIFLPRGWAGKLRPVHSGLAFDLPLVIPRILTSYVVLCCCTYPCPIFDDL